MWSAIPTSADLTGLDARLEEIAVALEKLVGFAVAESFAMPDPHLAIGTVGTTPTDTPFTGQTIGSTTAVRLRTGDPGVPTNGVIVQALKANASTVYVGPAGITTGSGYELQAGQAVAFTCSVWTLFVVGSNTTDGVCWSVV